MSKLCFGCMQMKEQSPVCEHCGYDERIENQPHQLPAGTILQNQYLVGRVLGQGGFGITYIGWDQHLSIPVATKEYYPNGVVQRHTQLGTQVSCVNGEAPEVFAKHRERFLKEARTLAQLSDIPEIVQIKSFFSANDTAYIVMEYIQGIALKEHLKKLGRPMTEEEVLTIMEPVLKALQKVHDHGLIHRDISPDNIMLPHSGGIKLIDFGTVRYIDDSGRSKSTESVLKPGFAPMEQYATRGALGTWTDVYALCATFHYLLTGKVPEEAMARLDGDGTLPLLRARQDLSPGLISALEQGMQVRIPDRIQSIAELYRLLYQQPDQPSEKRIKVSPSTQGRKSRRYLFALTAVLTAVLCAVLLPKFLEKGTGTLQPAVTQPVPETAQGDSFAMSEMDIRYNEAAALAQEGQYARAAIAFGKLGNYRDAREQSFALWDMVAYRETVAAASTHFIAVKEDGTVIACCEEYGGTFDLQNWTDIIAVSCTDSNAIGLKADGTVVASGSNDFGQCDVDSWQNIVAISTNAEHTVGLKSDGTVIAVGEPLWNEHYPTHIRTGVEDWIDIVAISTNEMQTMGLKLDGSVITTGSSNWEQEDLTDWSGLVSIDAANWNAVALRSDGTAVSTTEWNDWGQCNVSEWTDLVSISGGFLHTVGLKADGTVVAAGSNDHYMNWHCGQCEVSEWRDIVFVSTGQYITVGLCSDGTVVKAGEPWYALHSEADAAAWTGIQLPNRS